ncbi:MAG: SCO family protein [Candidatus Rokubacteria bacterium]|nr:SCO family protein [Candidatus Rokubacteria bacterium]
MGHRAAALALAGAALLPGTAGGAPATLPRLGPAPSFALTTQQGDRIWLAHLRGRAVVLAFGCTGCGVCPALVATLRDVARGLGGAAGRRVFFALVTVDPARDTPAALRRFARQQALDPAAWVLLTGSPAEIEVVTRRFGLAARRDAASVARDCLVVLIDQTGVIRGRYAAAELARLPADLETLLVEPPGF